MEKWKIFPISKGPNGPLDIAMDYKSSLVLKINCCPYIQNSKKLKQYRFPKSKKKRIRSKWGKIIINHKLVDDYVFIVDKTGSVYMNEDTLTYLKERLNFYEKDHFSDAFELLYGKGPVQTLFEKLTNKNIHYELLRGR